MKGSQGKPPGPDLYDVLVLGGGPAGLAAGITLAEAGVKTLLVERQRWPVDKPCGEGLMPTGWADLAALGVADLIPPAQQHPIVGIRYLLANGTTAEANFAPGPGRGLRRTVLSEALHARALRLPLLTLRDSIAATPLRTSDEGVIVQVGEEETRVKLLIGADGLNSKVRAWAGLDAGYGKRTRYGARQHFEVRPWTHHVEIHWQPGAEAYVTPASDTQVGVAFLWEKGRCDPDSGARLFPSLLQHFPRLAEKLGGTVPSSQVMAVGPFHRKTHDVIADGVLLLGDASGYLDAITGEGLSLSLAQARSLAETIAPVLCRSEGRVPVRDLRAYARAHRRISRSYYRMTRMALQVGRSTLLADRAVRALQREPRFFQHLLSANMGLHTPLSVSPLLLGRFGWALIRG